MKKIFLFIIGLFVLSLVHVATTNACTILPVVQGGTGNGCSEPLNPSMIVTTGTSTTSPYQASSTPVVATIFATSTTATSTFLGGINVAYLNQTGTIATSTFAKGIDLTNGCFSFRGTCIGGSGGGGSGTVNSGTITYLPFYAANGTTLSATCNYTFNSSNDVSSIGDNCSAEAGTLLKIDPVNYTFNFVAGNIGIGTLADTAGGGTKFKVLAGGSHTATASFINSVTGYRTIFHDSDGSGYNGYFDNGVDTTRYVGLFEPITGKSVFNGGNVGVGTSTPWAKLSASSTSAFPAFAVEQKGTGAAFVALGKVGISTTSPWGLLSVNPNGIAGPAFVVGSSTATRFVVTNGGKVGVGTSSPYANLSVAGQTVITNGGASNVALRVFGVGDGGFVNQPIFEFLNATNKLSMGGFSDDGSGSYGLFYLNGYGGSTSRLAEWDVVDRDGGGSDNRVATMVVEKDASGGGGYAYQFITTTAPGVFNTNVLYIGGTYANIGIGTNVPNSAYKLEVAGAIKTTDYYSSDGTVGFTGTCTLLSITAITVKNGLITDCN